MTAADVLVFAGMGALITGICGAFGWPWAAMGGGVLMLWAGGKLQQINAAKPTSEARN